jgi:hypothetical protein
MVMSLRPAATLAALMCLGLAGCSREAAQPSADQKAKPVPAADRKCPDPNIRDRNDPCSPYYWKPKDSALKDAKTF